MEWAKAEEEMGRAKAVDEMVAVMVAAMKVAVARAKAALVVVAAVRVAVALVAAERAV